MATVLILGGTRNLGYATARALHTAGHQVSVLNRGLTRDELPADITRLRADRTVPAQLEQALAQARWDVVVDFVLYDGTEANVIVDLLAGRVRHYVFISTGQVYLVRDGAPRPTREEDYAGPLLPEPPPNTYDHEEWSYGVHKRHAEDVLARAWAEQRFPYTSLRLPMVNSPRDPFNRLVGYMLRLRDGGPILVPDEPGLPLRHVYASDVVAVLDDLVRDGAPGEGLAFNLAQDEIVTLEDFLARLARVLGVPLALVRVPRATLEANAFLPECSPFSDRWMSTLDNARSKQVLGARYTPLDDALAALVAHAAATPAPAPVGYRRRHAERQFAEAYAGG